MCCLYASHVVWRGPPAAWHGALILVQSTVALLQPHGSLEALADDFRALLAVVPYSSKTCLEDDAAC